MKFFSRFFAYSAIRISGADVFVVKGKHTNRLLFAISSLCKDCEIDEGEIWFNSVGRVSFSKEIPERFHQRLRNVIGSAE